MTNLTRFTAVRDGFFFYVVNADGRKVSHLCTSLSQADRLAQIMNKKAA